MDLDAVRRIETQNESLRRRNGELLCLLQEIDPVAAESLTPIPNWPTRYQVIDRIVNLAVEFVYADTPAASDELTAELATAVSMNENYWYLVSRERSKREAKAAKARESKLLAENA